MSRTPELIDDDFEALLGTATKVIRCTVCKLDNAEFHEHLRYYWSRKVTDTTLTSWPVVTAALNAKYETVFHHSVLRKHCVDGHYDG